MSTPSPSEGGDKGWMRRVGGKLDRGVRRVGRSISGRVGGAVAGHANSSAGHTTGLLNVPGAQQNATPLMSASDSHLVVVASTQHINMVRPGASSSDIQHPTTTVHGTASPAIVPQAPESQMPDPSITPISPCTLINRYRIPFLFIFNCE